LFDDFEQADRVLGPTRNSAGAVEAGYISQVRAGRWLTSMAQAPFLATGVFFIVVAELPAQRTVLRQLPGQAGVQNGAADPSMTAPSAR
jgi:hypothetical protein